MLSCLHTEQPFSTLHERVYNFARGNEEVMKGNTLPKGKIRMNKK
jgi:hypothetical protein